MLWTLVIQLAVHSVLAAEPWRVVTELEATSGAEKRRALAVNEAGFRLAVEPLAGRSGARCTLSPPEDLAGRLAADDPAVLEVDHRSPQQVLRWQPSDEWEDGGDFAEALRRELNVTPLLDLGTQSVAFLCWKPLPRQASPTRGVLRQLLDGRELIVRLELVDGEYVETTFSLAGAREAIGEALDIPVEPSRRDILQDELLAFRVDYRKTTCYLLGGSKAEKRRKRCLEAVEACRGRDHDSVVSMLGCIEGE